MAVSISWPRAPLALHPDQWPDWLPRGGSLPHDQWLRRHRALRVLLWAHVLVLPAYAVFEGYTLWHGVVEASPALAAVVLAGYAPLGRTLQSALAAMGLMACSGVVVHLSGGMIEAHFHFFVMIPVVALYEAWLPFALGIGYVLVHHGVMGTLDPRSVYNHPGAWEHPWLFAGVHAAFFASACVACVYNWSLHERARTSAEGQSRLLSAIVDSLHDGLVVAGADGRVLLRNPAGESLMGGVDPNAAAPVAAAEHGIFHPDGTAVTEDELPYVQALAGHEVRDLDLVVRTPDAPEGRVLSFSATALPSGGSEGARPVVVLFRDITMRHRAEESMAAALAAEHRAVEQLRELEKVKANFVATVSHELRTPLTSIMGYLEVLAEGDLGDLNQAQAGLVDRLDRNGRRLLLLVEDLLTLSQIEASDLRITTELTDLRLVVRAAHEAVAGLLAQRDLAVAVELPDEPVHHEVDPVELERMLVNLLSNAVKFTPDGGRIEVTLATSGDDESTLVVTDTGMGIPEAEQDRLFTRFFRSSLATEQAVQGTGLGLTIVQGIVAMHGGVIQVQSGEGAGTTVTVRLPGRIPIDEESLSSHVG